MWQLAWAHPKFGSVLASCSYDKKVIIWKETNKTWSQIYEYKEHESSGIFYELSIFYFFNCDGKIDCLLLGYLVCVPLLH